MNLADIGELYGDARQSDFTKLANFVPLDRTLLREEHTITTCPAQRYSFGKHSGCLVAEGCHLDCGSLEFEAVPLGWPAKALAALGDVFSFYPMWLRCQPATFYSNYVRKALQVLAKHQVEFPAHRFLVVGSPWPGASRPAVIINNTFHTL